MKDEQWKTNNKRTTIKKVKKEISVDSTILLCKSFRKGKKKIEKKLKRHVRGTPVQDLINKWSFKGMMIWGNKIITMYRSNAKYIYYEMNSSFL